MRFFVRIKWINIHKVLKIICGTPALRINCHYYYPSSLASNHSPTCLDLLKGHPQFMVSWTSNVDDYFSACYALSSLHMIHSAMPSWAVTIIPGSEEIVGKETIHGLPPEAVHSLMRERNLCCLKGDPPTWISGQDSWAMSPRKLFLVSSDRVHHSSCILILFLGTHLYSATALVSLTFLFSSSFKLFHNRDRMSFSGLDCWAEFLAKLLLTEASIVTVWFNYQS